MRSMGMALICAVVCVWLAPQLGPTSALAQSPPPAQSEEQKRTELKAAWQAGEKAGTEGPADVTLIDQAVLKLPADYFFVPKTEATRIMRALGNTVSERTFVGLTIGTKQADQWIVVINYIKDGYIKDDEAKDWNADELLQSLKDGTEQANQDRVARGFDELEVLGWVERPAYDSATHRLVWSVLTKTKGEPDSADKGINYNTYALGRDGYFSLNLLTSSAHVSTDKSVARTLLAALNYNPAKGYEDFNASTDHIAEYGIAALVGGLVAKKLGLLALIGVFALKFFKLIAVAVLGLGAAITNFFRRKPKAAPQGEQN